ncbi:CYTH domain-containing protein [Tenacibaculum skagerrakense]|uniref:CYTH domain-containing protein n=1 Tax=Tenacibaculum skagerrakense TaxID=186571 RepID=A0A4V2SMP3_9FLAO|nr:CYTH domain-containing protein [Tenacibaculum skagerrakense]TCP28096.1 CYTH domain-containing protein [Tenacibaculum skagerrakense]
MSIEIERKFLVKDESFKKEAHQHSYIKQGFLNSNKERVVRVRINDEKGFITVKGKSNATGTSRFEWEKEITKAEANDLMNLCEKGIIEKYRYLVKSGNHIFEVDDFLGDNLGLVIAEVELSSENEKYVSPIWLGEEVTGKEEYYNSNLSKKPYSKW